MPSTFKDEVLTNALTPNSLGKFFIVSAGFVFAAGVMITSNQREHSDLRQEQAKSQVQISANSSATSTMSSEISQLATEVRAENGFAAERRTESALDRARIQRMLEQLLQRSD